MLEVNRSMDMRQTRQWMYNRLDRNRRHTSEFVAGVNDFITWATSQESFHRQHGKLRCPCRRCECAAFGYPDDVMYHLYEKGFMENYYHWTNHGEAIPQYPPAVPDQSYYGTNEIREEYNAFEQMVMDHAGPSMGEQFVHQEGATSSQNLDEDPNPEAQRFYDMLAAANSPLYENCESYTELSACMEALSIKSDGNQTEDSFNRWVQFIGRALPSGNKIPTNYYYAKKKAEGLGLGHVKIDCCPGGCMLYRHEDEHESVTNCRFCGQDRFKITTRRGIQTRVALKQMWYLPITPRLQRLYSSKPIASHMRWHAETHREPGVMCHPSDGEAWKHFDRTYPQFSEDPRNVRLGLCSDGFNPFSQYGKTYSCWPVILTPYNLPPGMCMKREFMFLTVIIPGPQNPKSKIDVYMQPLIEELTSLWNDGIITYDASLRQNFSMKAALMWTINDFPAYGMLSGWSTSGSLACPICMDQTKATWLRASGKHSWFDCHRKFLPHNHPYRRNKNGFKKNRVERSSPPLRLSGDDIWHRISDLPFIWEIQNNVRNLPGYGEHHHWTKKSIFWKLPYWKSHLLRHNLDVMHTERNVFMNIFDTVMDIKGKTKDTNKGRLDLSELCKRSELELQDVGGGKFVKPKGRYTLSKTERVAVCEWVKQLRLPDGYASNLGRCVDLREAKLHGMKSHDCHVFMQRLLPIAFRSLPTDIWKVLVELSLFFRELTCTTLHVQKMAEMEQSMPVLLCKLEQIFPPSFFDSMEHLPIHLPFEARVGGPVQYRWMYPFERYNSTS